MPSMLRSCARAETARLAQKMQVLSYSGQRSHCTCDWASDWLVSLQGPLLRCCCLRLLWPADFTLSSGRFWELELPCSASAAGDLFSLPLHHTFAARHGRRYTQLAVTAGCDADHRRWLHLFIERGLALSAKVFTMPCTADSRLLTQNPLRRRAPEHCGRDWRPLLFSHLLYSTLRGQLGDVQPDERLLPQDAALLVPIPEAHAMLA